MISLIAIMSVAAAFLSPSAVNAEAFLPPPTIFGLEKGEQTPVAPAVSAVPVVPFYSQFKDINSPKWQKVACGVTSLAMIIDYYKPDAVSANTLLEKGVAAGAYDKNAGWIYVGLIKLSQEYGLDGDFYDFGKNSARDAFEKFKEYSKDGPVIASVHYKLDPKNPIPHLIVVTGVLGDTVYYSDPAEKVGGMQISREDFLKAWKKRFVVVRPTNDNMVALSR